MKIYCPSKVSIDSSTEDIAQSINTSSGILLLTNLPDAPISEIQAAFDSLVDRRDLVDRLNNAYKSNLVYKDSWAMGKGGATVDMKRVLDLSPERLEEIRKNDPGLDLLEGSLKDTLTYWEHLKESIAPKIGNALAAAIGSDELLEDVAFNYRHVDYYQRDVNDLESVVAPRCGEHRDFGSYTLVFPNDAGFQVHVNGEWMDLPKIEAGSAILLFGWCTQIRSNGRIPALLHRVTDVEDVVRRTSAVFFCAPKKEETPLEPIVRDGEDRMYISGIKASQLRGAMRRKWKKREGTLSEEEAILEEKEIFATNMLTQDDVVKKIVMT